MTLPMVSRAEVRTTLADRFVEVPPFLTMRRLTACGRWAVRVVCWTGAALVWLLAAAWCLLFWIVIGSVVWGVLRLVMDAVDWIGRTF